jgi:FlaA1/EpsC-like NDP-sugar epimerase
MITLEDAVKLVWHAFEDMVGGEIYVKKIPSMTITDIAKAVVPGAEFDIIGIRPGEKLHEQMISEEDSYSTYEYTGHYKILPAINSWSNDQERIKDGKQVPEGFVYTSDNNLDWLSVSGLQAWIEENKNKIGKI